MNFKQFAVGGVILGLAIFASVRVLKTPSNPNQAHGHGHGHGDHHDHHDHHGEDHHAEEAAKGPHGGRVHTDGEFAIELKLDEADGSPRYVAHPSLSGKPLDPRAVQLIVRLLRFGGRIDTIGFNAQGDVLKGDSLVAEPHSFLVEIEARHAGKIHQWSYESFEARVVMDKQTADESGIATAVAGPALFEQSVRVQGRVEFRPGSKQAVPARFGGLVKEFHVRLGDKIQAGDLVAVVESSGSLKPYEVRATLAGAVLEIHSATGQAISDGGTLCVIADNSQMSVALQIPPQFLPQTAKGQRIQVSRLSGEGAESVLDWISPTVDKVTQAAIGRAVLANPDGRWLDGTAVMAKLVVGRREVPVAVKAGAIQTMGRWQMVFLNDGEVFQGMPVETGATDGEMVEILSGIEAGSRYVESNSFLLKADILKEGASHDH